VAAAAAARRAYALDGTPARAEAAAEALAALAAHCHPVRTPSAPPAPRPGAKPRPGELAAPASHAALPLLLEVVTRDTGAKWALPRLAAAVALAALAECPAQRYARA
jgi:hypothetical protein